MHVCDTDSNTWHNAFGTHLGIGKGIVDFDALIPAVVDAGYTSKWWSVDAIPMTAETWADTWTDRIDARRPARQARPATAERSESEMKAAVFYEPNDIRVEDVPEPTIAEDEVLVEVAACGFCGSDVEYYYGKSPVGTADGKGPLVLGHEFSGKVVGLGKIAGTYGLAGGRPGRGLPDPELRRLQLVPGGQAAVLREPVGARRHDERRLRAVREDEGGARVQAARTRSRDEQGAFVEMLAAAVNAVHKAEVEPDDFAVVYGPGPVGLSMVQLLRNEGARVAVVGTRRLPPRRGEAARRGLRRSRAAPTSPTRSGGERRQPRRPRDRRDRLDGRRTSRRSRSRAPARP